MIDDAMYPIRKVAGTGCWVDGHLVVRSQYPPGRHVLNESAAAVLLCCDGDRDIRQIVEMIAADCRGTPQDVLAAQIHHCLTGLAAGQLIEFAEFACEAVPVVRVGLLRMRPGSRPTCTEVLEMIGQSMLTLVSDDDEVDVTFEFELASEVRPMDDSVGEHLRILVTNESCIADPAGFDCVLSYCDTAELTPSSCNSRNPPKNADVTSIRVDSYLSERFYDFLFPVDGGEICNASAKGWPELTASYVSSGAGFQAETRGHDRANDVGTSHHVFLSTDHRQSPGLFALVNSILANSRAPDSFLFHLLVDGHCNQLSRILDERFGRALRYELMAFPEVPGHRECLDFLKHNIRIEGVPSARLRLDSVMNFARLYLPDLFPHINVGLYLDVDTIVQTDLADLFAVDVSSTVLAAVANHSFGHYHSGLDLQGRGFNGGVLLINFEHWRNSGIRETLEGIMTLHRRRRLFRGGTEPLLNVACRGQWRKLDPLWNVSGLGFRDDIDESMLMNGRILHWSGSRKPWLEGGLYRHHWNPYRVPAGHETRDRVDSGS